MTTPDAVAAAAPYVFLSYASVDRERALTLADALERAGVRVWVDRRAIAGGSSWGAEIVEGIERCAALLIVCTQAAMQSRNVRQEIQLAWRYERPYVPLLLEPADFPQQVQYFLEGYQWVEALERPEADWRPVLLAALARLGVAASPPAVDQSAARTPDAPRAPTAGEAAAGARSLVGRAAELAALRAALERAAAGEGRLVLLAGEPGIGKTRLAQALSDEAAGAGALVLWGRCWEGEGAPAFWPWIQAIGAYARGQDPEALRRSLGRAAPDLAVLMPEVAAVLPDLPPPPPSDPETARFRLFGAVAAFLAGLALERPLVIVLDDLHWADKPSLLLLQFLARELSTARILVLGTYRDTDLDRRHPLDEALTGLRREAAFERVALRGLSREEVTALMETRAGHALDAPGRALAGAIHRETEGNPFFVGETLRHLAETGGIRRRDGRWEVATASVAELGIPEGVRQVIGRRLSRLSEGANALLAVAAVVGREFGATTLEHAGGRDADAVDAALEEAERAQLVGDVAGRPGRFRFAHALIRETLYEELPARRRVRLHRQVGDALEASYGARADAHAAELARHLAEAADRPETAGKAVRYAALAAEQAEAATAWEEAARHYEQALTLLAEDGGGATDADEAALLTALGRCHRNVAQWRPAWRSLMRAITLYRERGDAVGQARATLEAVGILSPVERRRALADDALGALAGREPYLEARLLVAHLRSLTPDERPAAFARVDELAERHGYGDIAGLALAERAFFRYMLAGDLAGSAALARAGYEALVAAGRPTEAAIPLVNWCWSLADAGDLTAAQAALTEAIAYARSVHARFQELLLLTSLAALHLLRGEAASFDRALEDTRGEAVLANLLAAARAEQAGDVALALSLLPEPAAGGGFPPNVANIHAGRARVRFNAGDEAGARAEARGYLDRAATLFERQGALLYLGQVQAAREALPT